MGRVTDKYQQWVPKAAASDLFPYAYTFKCIKSIDELKEVLSVKSINRQVLNEKRIQYLAYHREKVFDSSKQYKF